MRKLEDIQALFSQINWDDAFIKSVSFESPTYIKEDHIIAPGSLGDVEIELRTLDPNYPQLLLRCRRVYEIKMSFCFDFGPKLQSSGGRVRLQLLRSGENAIEAEDIEIW